MRTPQTLSIGVLFVVSIPSNLPAQSLTLTQLSTTFNTPIGIDFHEPTGSLILSVNYSSGLPHNFERILVDGSHVQFSTVAGFTNEVKIAAVRADANPGGFTPGDLFTGNGIDGEIVRITDDGATVINPWVSLPGAGNGLMRGSLYVDRTGVFGGDLVVVTTAGEVWRIDATGNPTTTSPIADVNVHLEGVVTVPDDPVTYGPLAAKILAGAEEQGLLYAFDATGAFTTYNLGVAIEDIDIIPANENFFGVNFGTSRLLSAPSSEFTFAVGDILLTEESPPFPLGSPGLLRLFWNGANLQVEPFTLAPGSQPAGQWEHVTFAPLGVNPFPNCTLAPTPPFTALVGRPFTFTVTASDTPGDTVTLTAVGVPAGATLTPPLPAMGNPITVTFDWTPTSADLGAHSIVFTATDSTGLQAPPCAAPVTVECGGLFAHYGAGVAGSGGFVPTIDGTGCPAPGATVTIDIANGLGGTCGCLVLGFSPATDPAPGGTILVAQPWLVFPHDMMGSTGSPGVGTFSMDLSIPADPSLQGITAYLQAGYLDPGGPAGITFTDGLSMTI